MITVRIQPTPNPKARKYILNALVKAEGKASYDQEAACAHVPMFAALMGIRGVARVHGFQNALTITQDGYPWQSFDAVVQKIIHEFMDTHDPHFTDPVVMPQPLTGALREIDEILSATIRPNLQADGGDVVLLSWEAPVLTLGYQGACGGCPSSLSATLEAMTHILRTSYDPSLQIVVRDLV